MMAAIFMAMNLGSRSLLQEAAMTHTEVMETIKYLEWRYDGYFKLILA